MPAIIQPVPPKTEVLMLFPLITSPGGAALPRLGQLLCACAPLAAGWLPSGASPREPSGEDAFPGVLQAESCVGWQVAAGAWRFQPLCRRAAALPRHPSPFQHPADRFCCIWERTGNQPVLVPGTDKRRSEEGAQMNLADGRLQNKSLDSRNTKTPPSCRGEERIYRNAFGTTKNVDVRPASLILPTGRERNLALWNVGTGLAQTVVKLGESSRRIKNAFPN